MNQSKQELMDDLSRRRLLLATGGIAGLAGCSALPGGSSDPSAPAGGEPEELTNAEGAQPTDENTEVEPSLDAVTVEKTREIDNNPRNMWRVVNESSSLLQMATVSRLVPSEVEGVELEEEQFVTFAIPPGGRRRFQSRGENETTLIEPGTWFNNQNQPSSEQADTTSPGVGISESGRSPEAAPTPAEYNYKIPNPTGIQISDAREATIDIYALEIESGSFQYGSPRPMWNQTHEIKVDGTTESETFTWTASPPPQIDVSLGGTLGNLKVSLEAKSQTPLINPVIYVVALGPNVNDDRRGRTIYRDQEYVTGNETTTALITDTVGETRVGDSRTVSLPYDTNVNFPVSEDDRLIAGVASAQMVDGYPVASTEVPLAELVE